MSDELAEDVSAIGALVDPVRRALYLFVASQPEPVSREQAATALGVPLHSVKFHLDRLVSEGLLEAGYRRLSGKSGPGAGRPSKLYHRSSRQVSLSLPARRYDLAGDVLASAIDQAVRDGLPIDAAVRQAAAAEGRRLAAAFVAQEGQVDGSGLARTADVLAQHGYEPTTVGGEVHLCNCPFDRLTARHTDLVCTMNLALIDGVIEGLDVPVVAQMAATPGYCCVKVVDHAAS